MRSARLPLFLPAALACWGCSGSESGSNGSQDGGTVQWQCEEVPRLGLDILFVIDNSSTMRHGQDQLTDQIDTLLRGLVDAEGALLDVHIGVVSTDLGSGPYTTSCSPVDGDAGELQADPRVPRCTEPLGNPYIEVDNLSGALSGNIVNVDTPTGDGLSCQGLTDADGNRVPADGDVDLDFCDIQAAFECIARLGNSGCGFEQPLEAARRALTCTEETCTNPGFLRNGAALAVVFLGNEDDCSARIGELFDPSQVTLNSELGPPNSFRCFEFGVTCDDPVDRGVQTLTGCRSITVADVSNLNDLYLFPVQEYYDFLTGFWPLRRIVVAGITGPYSPGDTIRTEINTGGVPQVEPSCGSDEDAFPAVRLNEFIRMFGDSGIVLEDLNAGDGICTDDFRPALGRLADRLEGALEPGCTPGCQKVCNRLARCLVEVCNDQCATTVFEEQEADLRVSCMDGCQDNALGVLTEQQWRCYFEESCFSVLRDDVCEAGSYYFCRCP